MNRIVWGPGALAPGFCPTCKREYFGQLGIVDWEAQICRCGKPWNRTARKSLRNWRCQRKQRMTREEAIAASDTIRMESRGVVEPYKCSFCPSYHVGHSILVDTEQTLT